VSAVALRAVGVRMAGEAGAVLEPVPRAGDRWRRATRECRLAVDAVEALLEDGGLARDDIAGADTALVYVTAMAYGASNRAFAEGGGHALHFPYTAPSAVPAEVAIEFGLHGPYAVLIGGAATTIDAIQHAAVLLTRGACTRAIVLAVETFAESEELLRRGHTVDDGPLVEAAVAGLFDSYSLEMGGPRRAPQAPHAPRPGGAGPLRERFRGQRSLWGQRSLACGPLIELAERRDEAMIELRGTWRGREAVITVGGASQSPVRATRKES
jgi:hypothetical protein